MQCQKLLLSEWYTGCLFTNVNEMSSFYDSLGVSQSGHVIAEKPQIKDGRKIEITAVLCRGNLSIKLMTTFSPEWKKAIVSRKIFCVK